MPEAGDDPGDDLAVAVLTDEDVRAWPAVPEGNHQLLRVPEGQDDRPPFAIERIDRFRTALLEPHRPTDGADKRRADRRQHRQFDPLLDLFLCRHLYGRRFSHLYRRLYTLVAL